MEAEPLDLKLSDEEINDAMIHDPGIGSHGRAIADAASAKTGWAIVAGLGEWWDEQVAKDLEAQGMQRPSEAP